MPERQVEREMWQGKGFYLLRTGWIYDDDDDYYYW